MPVSLPSDQDLEVIVRTLPAAPRILAELAPRLQALDADVPDITQVLRRDSGLTARLIDMANSAAYMGFDPATSIEDAVARIGFRDTYRIVGAVASTQIADERLAYYGVQPRRLRENSLFCALMMEELADVAFMDAATGYTVGLLRSIGKVVLDRLARRHARITPFDPMRQPLLSWERLHWGCTNADIAAHVLEFWGFPDEAVETVRTHYLPSTDAPRNAHLLNLAAGAAELRGFGLPAEQRYWRLTGAGLESARIDEARLNWASERAYTTLSHISVAFA